MTESMDLNKKKNHSTSDLQVKGCTQMANGTLDKLTSPPNTVQFPVNMQAQPNLFFDQLFTFSELNLAIDSRDVSSGSGLDGVDYYTIAKLPIKYKLILLDIYNEMFKNSDYPESWKSSFVHLIKKAL